MRSQATNNISLIGLLMPCQQTCNSSSLRRFNLLTWDELISQARNMEDELLNYIMKLKLKDDKASNANERAELLMEGNPVRVPQPAS